MSLERFQEAQASHTAGYPTALAEIRAGAKRSHWIWYIFPQIAGLGRSAIAREYALRDVAEACDYLRDPLLRSRYEEISAVVQDQIACGTPIETLMGGSIDALKLVSSLTLFRAAADMLAKEDPTYASVVARCGTIIEQATRQGYPQCSHTLARLAAEAALDQTR
jgi:uncharacterized protein (DUF1810 family)